MPAPASKYASTVQVGAKGQIVIPKRARDMFGIKPGDTLLLLADIERGIAIVRPDLFEQFPDSPGGLRTGHHKPDRHNEKSSDDEE